MQAQQTSKAVFNSARKHHAWKLRPPNAEALPVINSF